MTLTLITNERFQRERAIRAPETALVDFYGSEKALALKEIRASAMRQTDWADLLCQVREMMNAEIGVAATRELFEHQANIAKLEEELSL